MKDVSSDQPPDLARFSGLYRFIPSEDFEQAGIDPVDVPLGTFPAEDHPPFLPNRFGGNAYGLGLFEQTVLPSREARLLESVKLTNPSQVAEHYREINLIFKRLGLLIRFNKKGTPFYLIPHQFVAHYMVEIQARAEEVISMLSALMARRLRESLRVGLLTGESDLIVPELRARVPQMDFRVLDTLAKLTAPQARFDALVMVGDPRKFVFNQLAGFNRTIPKNREKREGYGYFVASRLYDLLDEDGEFLCLADRPQGTSREKLSVRFLNQSEFKRFLIFSHVYRTRRRYLSSEGTRMEVNRLDFNAFLSGLGIYHDTVEGLLDGRRLAHVEPGEIDSLPFQNLTLPRGSAPQLMAAWRRWFKPFFRILRLESILPEAQRTHWENLFEIEGGFPDTLVVFKGRRRRPAASLARIESRQERQHLAGCDPKLLARYKDTFTYVLKVLSVLMQLKEGSFLKLPGLELSRLRKPFETTQQVTPLKDVSSLMGQASALQRWEARLNPDQLMGPQTPVLENLEKLSLMGLKEGPLRQLRLIVLGHSTMVRVTFGKLPATSLSHLTDLSRYNSLSEGISVLRLYRLLSVAEAAAASPQGLSSEQSAELLALYDDAVRVMTDPELTWEDLLADRTARMGGVQTEATQKMLKLFNLFEFMDSWRDLEAAGPHLKEAIAGYDPRRLDHINQAIDLVQQLRRFVGRYYASDSSARPFFFRALLNCEMHGTGRLLPQLGASAGFTLLWICVHLSGRRPIDFNSLLDVEPNADSHKRLDKLRRSLDALTPQDLSPGQLLSLQRTMQDVGEAYILGTGIYLSFDQESQALTPRFVDAEEKLEALEEELAKIMGTAMTQVASAKLALIDEHAHEVGRFLKALAQAGQIRRGIRSNRAAMTVRLSRLREQMGRYVIKQLFDLGVFADNLGRLLEHCPNLMNRLLPRPVSDPETSRRRAAAVKLSSLYLRRLESFQDMQLSHETARAEFGTSAAGIVGVSPLQFEGLTNSISQVLKVRPDLGLLMMLAVLCYSLKEEADAAPSAEKFVAALGLSQSQADDLDFLLNHVNDLWEIISGQACHLGLKGFLSCQDPVLMEALFLLSVIIAAVRREGLLSEDLLEAMLAVRDQVRELVRHRTSVKQAHRLHIETHARHYLAFEHYREIQEGEAPTASLGYLLEHTKIPDKDRKKWMTLGRKQAGLERLFKLRGLYSIEALDLLLLRHEVPVTYIYRRKGLRSMGETHFERDLFEAFRVYRGLSRMDEDLQEFLLEALTSEERPLRLWGFAHAAGLLTYDNQIKLLFSGLAASRLFEVEPGVRVTISFLPLARVIERKFEQVNQAVTDLDPRKLWGRPRSLHRLEKANEGITLSLDSSLNRLSLGIAEPKAFDRKIAAVRGADNPNKLKVLYHRELRKLKLTTHSTLDYQQRLESAFQRRLDELAEEMLERVGTLMSQEKDLSGLIKHFDQAWEEGLELPLGRDRQQSLRDLLELNVERLRAELLQEVTKNLAATDSFADLDKLWQKVKDGLKQNRSILGKSFEILVAERFDERTRQLRAETDSEGQANRS